MIRLKRPRPITLMIVGALVAALAALSASTTYAVNTCTITPTSGANGSLSPSTAQTVVSQATVVTLVGDSITQGVAPDEWPYILASRLGAPSIPATPTQYLLADGQVADRLVCGSWTIYDSGRNGFPTNDMLSWNNWDVNVLGHEASDYIVIMGGTCDVDQGRGVANCTGNLAAMVGKCVQAGAIPVLSTILPQTYATAGEKQQILDINTWIRESSGARYVDMYALAENPVGSGNQSGGDGIHPTAATHLLMGNGFDLALLGWVEPPVFNIMADPGYHIGEVLVDGTSVGAVSTYAFRNVIADHTISATFAIDTFTTTSSHGLNGSIAPDGSSVLDYGSDSATYTITPSAGSVIANVVVDGVSKGAIRTYKFENVVGNHTITATFKRVTKLAIASSRTTVYHNHSVTYSGTIAPNMAGGTHVIVEIRKSGSSKWTTMSTRHTYGSHHWYYSYTPRTRRPGTYYVRARYAGSTTNTSCASASRKLVIR